MSNHSKIRILECIRQGKVGGGESHLVSLMEHIDRDRFDPIVLSFTPGPMVDRLKSLGIETHVIYTEKPFDISIWKKVKNFINEQQVSLIHAHGTRANSNISWAAKRLGIPVIYTIHGWSFHQDQGFLIRNMRVIGEKYLTASSALNISVSGSNRDSGRKKLGNFNSVVVNNGIDQQRFSPEGNFQDIRAELGIPKKAVLLLFIARFTGHKQPLTLIRAFRKAATENPSLHLLMVGDGDEKEAALKMVADFGLTDKITFQPFRNDVPDVLVAADMFILPSLWEGLPIGLLEAMAMGRAVIATKVDGTSEVVNHRENGLLFEPGDLEALTSAIAELAGNEQLRAEFGERAIATVKKKFNAHDMTRKIEQIYIDLLSGSN